jgi:hypothetical protein
MHGLWAGNDAKSTSADGKPSIRIARGTQFCAGYRRADWKIARRFVNMENCCRSERIRTEPIWEIPVEKCLFIHWPVLTRP